MTSSLAMGASIGFTVGEETTLLMEGPGSDYILYNGDRADYEITREGSTRNATVEWIGLALAKVWIP